MGNIALAPGSGVTGDFPLALNLTIVSMLLSPIHHSNVHSSMDHLMT
jgi:hypothetical protein